MSISFRTGLMTKGEHKANDLNELIAQFVKINKLVLEKYNTDSLVDVISTLKFPTSPENNQAIYLINREEFDLRYHPRSGTAGICFTVVNPQVRSYLDELVGDARVEFIKACGKHPYSFIVERQGTTFIDTHFYVSNMTTTAFVRGGVMVNLIEEGENGRHSDR